MNQKFLKIQYKNILKKRKMNLEQKFDKLKLMKNSFKREQN